LLTKKLVTAVQVVLAVTILATALAMAQAPAQPPPTQPPPAPGTAGRGAGGQGGGERLDYPPRPPADPAAVERGKGLYSSYCAFCHGPDARGGANGGPSLIRSQLVLSDQKGELIAEVVQHGRPGTPMQPIKLTLDQISDIAAFVHSFRVGGYDITREPPPSIVVGDAPAGELVFKSKCASCHSISGDLKGIGARFDDPRELQQTWLLPYRGRRGRGAEPPNAKAVPTVTVTLPSREKVEGRLVRVDDFVVTLAMADGTERTFARNGDIPTVEIHDPLLPHRQLMPKYTDKEIHDLTAYLVTVK
jgi:cytochrome c oxidase cbb3-type subunit 3